ncbi:MAG: hypothetical protein H6711_15065 [Myxococcales bacterium]|nr:hypothetical protein [Myxococcales bacterium]
MERQKILSLDDLAARMTLVGRRGVPLDRVRLAAGISMLLAGGWDPDWTDPVDVARRLVATRPLFRGPKQLAELLGKTLAYAKVLRDGKRCPCLDTALRWAAAAAKIDPGFEVLVLTIDPAAALARRDEEGAGRRRSRGRARGWRPLDPVAPGSSATSRPPSAGGRGTGSSPHTELGSSAKPEVPAAPLTSPATRDHRGQSARPGRASSAMIPSARDHCTDSARATGDPQGPSPTSHTPNRDHRVIPAPPDDDDAGSLQTKRAPISGDAGSLQTKRAPISGDAGSLQAGHVPAMDCRLPSALPASGNAGSLQTERASTSRDAGSLQTKRAPASDAGSLSTKRAPIRDHRIIPALASPLEIPGGRADSAMYTPSRLEGRPQEKISTIDIETLTPAAPIVEPPLAMVRLEWRRGSEVTFRAEFAGLNDAFSLIRLSAGRLPYTICAIPYVNGERIDIGLEPTPVAPPPPPPHAQVAPAPAPTAAPPAGAVDPAERYLQALAALTASRPSFPLPLELLSAAISNLEKINNGDER